MQVPQIRISSNPGKISIEQPAGRQHISQPKADQTIQQPKASLKMQTIPQKLTIDQTEAWEDMNMVSTLRQTEINAQAGKQALSEGVARRARQGTELMSIENDGNPIVQQAKVNGHDQMKSLGITFIPSPFSVKINYQSSEVRIDAHANQPQINAKVNAPKHEYERGHVRIDMLQKPALKIDFIPE